MAEDEKESKKEVEITNIPTGQAIAYKLPDGSEVNLDGLLVWIANKVLRIEKAVA